MPRVVSLLLLALLLIVSPLQAASWTVRVSAGDHDRMHTPVVVDLPVTDSIAFELKNAAGETIPSQAVVPSLHTRPAQAGTQLSFILPSLAKGQTAQFKVTQLEKPLAITGTVFQALAKKDELEQLNFGDRPVLRYVCLPLDETTPATREATYKVFHHVFDPDGSRIITKGPGGKYTHHRGLYFGFNKVSFDEGKKTCDVWHCSKGAYQSHDKLLRLEAGPVLGRQRVLIGWHDNDKATFAAEQRELTTYAIPGGTLIDFASQVDTKVGPIKLDGDPQHAGFHFRADNEVSDVTAKQTYYLRPDGAGKRGETRNWDAKLKNPQAVNLAWNAMSFVLGEQRYTALYLDHPQNPKEARYSERDYGRFGSYFEYEITEQKPLAVRYRVWIVRGELTGPECVRLSNDFVSPPTVEIK